MNSSAALSGLVAAGVVTVMATVPVPAPTAGEMAVMEVVEPTVKLVALVEPKLTPVAPVKLVPVMLTELSPAGRPATGLIAVTVGATS